MGPAAAGKTMLVVSPASGAAAGSPLPEVTA